MRDAGIARCGHLWQTVNMESPGPGQVKFRGRSPIGHPMIPLPPNPEKESVCGVILTGGKSLRMGLNKAFLNIQGQPMVVRSAAHLAAVTDEILISSNDPAPYEVLGLPVIPDLYPGQGPLAGLHAAMAHTRRSLVLLLACDLPRIHSGMLARLIHGAPGFDAVVPRTTDERVHPLCAVYRRTCFKHIEANLVCLKNKMVAFLENPSLKVNWLEPAEGSFVDEDLINLNSPNDLEAYLASLR